MNKLKKIGKGTQSLSAAGLILTVLIAAVPQRPWAAARWQEERFEFQQIHMGTRVRVILYAPDRIAAGKAAGEAFARIGRLDHVYSDYRNDSELTRFVEASGSGMQPVDPDLFQILNLAGLWARQTGGLFDVTMAPVVQLWRRARRTGELPDPARLREARQLVDIRQLRLDPPTRRAELARPGMRIDLGGIAKGYAAQEAIRVLTGNRIRSALVAIGGDIAVSLPPPGESGWQVGVASLDGGGQLPSLFLSLREASVPTSGDAEQSVVINGVRYSHIVDPRTGIGLQGRRSATVVASDGATSDVLATTLCILGSDRGLRLVDRLAGSDPKLAAFYEEPALRATSKRWKNHLATLSASER